MKRTILVKFILLFVIVFPAYSQVNNFPPATIINSDTVTDVALPVTNFQYLAENGRVLTFQDILKLNIEKQFAFVKGPLKAVSRIDNLWFRYSIKNNLSKPIAVALPEYLSRADVYISERQSNFKHFTNGWNVPWSKRDGLKKLYNITYTIPANGTITVFERDEDFDTSVIQNGLAVSLVDQLIKQQYFNSQDGNSKNIIFASLSGFFIFAAIFNFFFFYTTREKVYLIFGLCVLFETIVTWPYSPILLREMPGNYYSLLYVVLHGVSYVCFMGTVVLFLLTPKYHPLWNKVILGGSGAYFILTVSWQIAYVFGNKSIAFNYLNSATNLGIWINVLIFIVVGLIIILDLVKKRRSAKIFIIAVTPCLLANVLYKLYSSEVISQLSLMWGVLVMNWSLFDRFKRLQVENAQQALEQEEERNRLMAQQKVELEIQVADRTAELSQSLTNLKATQTQLIQSEKMASLGELTAGIAHEIQNPLNFVNNFSEVSIELLGELKDESEAGNKEEVIAIANDLTENLEKIHHHGKRADSIVKGMLQHSRTGTGERQLTDINTLAEEFLKLSYHGLRSKDKDFNADMITHLDKALPKINIVQQDIGRVLLNLFNNAFYAVNEKKKNAGIVYRPEVTISTATAERQVTIKVKDNGNGVPAAIKDKIMQPFFSTKPTGQGTGLGLSLSYDIIVKGLGGNIYIESEEGNFSEFTVVIPI